MFHHHKSNPPTCQTHQGELWKGTHVSRLFNIAKTSVFQQHRIRHCLYEHKLRQYEYKWELWLSVISLSAHSKQQTTKNLFFIIRQHASTSQRGGEVREDEVKRVRGDAKREWEEFPCQAVRKTGINLCSAGRHGIHCHGNRPCATPPSISTSSLSPPLPITRLRQMTPVSSLCHCCCVRISVWCWIFITHHNIQGTLQLSICLTFYPSLTCHLPPYLSFSMCWHKDEMGPQPREGCLFPRWLFEWSQCCLLIAWPVCC